MEKKYASWEQIWTAISSWHTAMEPFVFGITVRGLTQSLLQAYGYSLRGSKNDSR